MNTKMVVTSIVTVLLGLLASFHIVLPATVNATTVVGFVMITGSAVLVIFRFYHDGVAVADAKSPWLSKTVWTGIVGGVFGGLALFGIVPPISQSDLIQIVLVLVGVAGAAFGGTAKTAIA